MVAAVAFLATVVYLVILLLRGIGLFGASIDVALWAFGALTLISLFGWWLDRRRMAADAESERLYREKTEAEAREREAALHNARGELNSVREEEAELRQSLQRAEARLEERESALGRERYLRTRSEEAQRAEREWSHELQAEVMRAHRELGTLGDSGGVPAMVLRLAKRLLGADKGLLLSRVDEDADGKLDLIHAEGFENDPEDSALVQRFAGQVIERDQIIREEEPQETGQASSSADGEIENLVAIPIYIQDNFNGVIVCANKEGGFQAYDEDVLLSLGNQAGAVLNNARLRDELRSSYLATVRLLGAAIEAKDPFLRGHSEEVSGYVVAVADRLGLEPAAREQLLFTSLLHDVGKIGISERILLKPAKLTREEFGVIKLHPRIGYHIVRQVPALEPMALGILHHHERFDGAGYPAGLRGEEIPLEARVVCVADAFSAMTAGRPYGERMPPAEACAELERHAGTQFDPDIVRIFVEEVHKRPPGEENSGNVEALLEDPEIRLRRDGDEPLLGFGQLALTDNLTMLYTRRYFHERAEAEARHSEAVGRSFGVVVVELVEISRINDLQGYAAGDEAIRTVARAVQRVASRVGGTACRYGGHRLGLLAAGADERAVDRLAEMIPVELPEGLRIRTGTAFWRPGDDGDSVIVRASSQSRT